MAELSATELLQKLVSLPSVNPEDTGDPAITGEQRMAEFLAAWLGGRGFRVEWVTLTPGRPNLVARYGPEKPTHRLLFEGHLDTVSVAGMTRDPFAGDVENGRLYGRGACDMKGAMAALLAALEPARLARAAAAGWEIQFVGAMGEEKGNRGAEELVGAGCLEADGAIVLEPTGLALVHAHKGSLWYAIELTGRPGHGSDPEAGVSAIEGLPAVMELLHKEVDEQAERHRDALLGAPTVNVGKVSGGAAVNIVPAFCRVEVDRRTLPGERHEEILARVRDGLDRLKEERLFTDYRIVMIKDAAAYEAPPESPLVRRLGKACERCGVPVRTAGSSWYSDAGPMARVCRDVVVFGPGHIEQAHTADEYIELDELARGTEILTDLLEHLVDDGER